MQPDYCDQTYKNTNGENFGRQWIDRYDVLSASKKRNHDMMQGNLLIYFYFTDAFESIVIRERNIALGH